MIDKKNGSVGKHYTPTENILSNYELQLFSYEKPIIYESTGLRLRKGRITIINAEPGKGKSSYVSQVAFEVLRQNPDCNILICNVEMTPQQMLDRELSRLSGVDHTKIEEHTFDDSEKVILKERLPNIKAMQARFTFLNLPFSINEVVEVCNEIKPDILIVDYIQEVKHKKGSDLPKIQELEKVTSALRLIANSGIAIIAIGQMNRNGNSYKGESSMARSKGSGDLEYCCDDLYQLDNNLSKEDKNLAQDGVFPTSPTMKLRLEHLKSRNGKRRHIDLEFTGNIHTWQEVGIV